MDNQQRKLSTDDLIITADNKPVALAGVMGGLNSEVTSETSNLLIESAYFDKVSVMNTSRKLNLISDASIRFERGIDHKLQILGINRFISIFEDEQEIAYSLPITDTKKDLTPKKVTFKRGEIYKLLGINLKDDFISDMLSYLGIEF